MLFRRMIYTPFKDLVIKFIFVTVLAEFLDFTFIKNCFSYRLKRHPDKDKKSKEFLYQNYYNDVIDSSFINTIVDDLVKTYKKMPLRIRNRISKSCYNIQTVTKTTSNIDSGLIWAEGEVNLSFNFQLNKPYRRYWFKRVLGIF
jgi:hypothetical protein